ncbi:MAG: hypothetical protein M1829_005695 [Trizodia sp. TS-e1964]|nr:MAG: hypothetical protein M1829_005695 [Trizodia sp. TS-e1964]
MQDGRPHPLLAQIPLTVSPFVSLPSATTLPYTYKSLPSTLPPPSTGDGKSGEKNKYVVSSTGHAAHPDEIVASCRALQAHLQQMQTDAENILRGWEDGIRQQELAEKRRVAPGWLDSDAKMLEPEKKLGSSSSEQEAFGQQQSRPASVVISPMGSPGPPLGQARAATVEKGNELDRAFGGMGLQ